MPEVKVEDLYYTYPAGPVVLKGLNFAVEAGETLALVGLSGCGKTTLCQCLCGIVPHVLHGDMQGQVLIKGRETTEYRLPRLACEIGMVFQTRMFSWFVPPWRTRSLLHRKTFACILKR